MGKTEMNAAFHNKAIVTKDSNTVPYIFLHFVVRTSSFDVIHSDSAKLGYISSLELYMFPFWDWVVLRWLTQNFLLDGRVDLFYRGSINSESKQEQKNLKKIRLFATV